MSSTGENTTGPDENRIAEIAADVRASGDTVAESSGAAAERAAEIREQTAELVQRGETAALDPARRPWVPKALAGTVAGLVTWRILRRHR